MYSHEESYKNTHHKKIGHDMFEHTPPSDILVYESQEIWTEPQYKLILFLFYISYE